MSATPLVYLLAAGALAWSAGAHAQSFRCRGELVSVGDRSETVRQKCGEPATRDRGCEPGPLVNGVAACVDVERWTYRPGYGQFVTTLSFDEDGSLVAITYGDRQ